MNPNRKGQAGNPVSTGMQSATYTPFVNTHFNLPYGLYLRQTILTGTTSVTIPAGITFVYAIAVGAGGAGNGGGGSAGGGGAGGVAWGWTIATGSCIVGAGGTSTGGYTRYGNIIAGGGAPALQNSGTLGSGGGGGQGQGAGAIGNGGAGILYLFY